MAMRLLRYRSSMTRILLARHGESEWNAVGRWQGQADPPLTSIGRRQARNAAELVGSVELIVCSDLERARDTAEIISAQIGIGPVAVDTGWRERDAGEWSGLTRAQIHEQWPGYLDDDPVRRQLPTSGGADQRRPPGWEGDGVLLERTLAAIGRVASEVGDGEALVVTHGGVIYNLEHHLGVDAGRMANLGGRVVLVDGGGRLTLGERTTLVNHEPVTTTASEQEV